MNIKLKEALEQLCDLCSEQELAQNGLSKDQFREQIKAECMHFPVYLSSSDGQIRKVEADFIRDYFGLTYTAEALQQYIVQNHIYTRAFEQTVPESLKFFLRLDNDEKERGCLQGSRALAYLHVFEELGKEFLVCDGEKAENEVADYTIYTTMLRDYIREEALFDMQTPEAMDTLQIHGGEAVPQFDENGERIETLDDLLAELNGLVGLNTVKQDVNSLIHLQEVCRIRKERGMKTIPVSNHLVFYGNPGTGKTTVARLLAKIYHAMGILSKGQLVEVDRSGLVAGYVGQTAIKVQEVVQSALGGILFIDEAYTLTSSDSGNDYGQEAVDILLKAMEDNREDFIVIVAGYPALMQRFIDSNPGLRSRFNKYIDFVDYTVPELLQIFVVMCENNGYKPTQQALLYGAGVCAHL